MDDLIREEDGEIRRCPANMAKLGYWKSYRLFFGYRDAAEQLDWSEIVEAFVGVCHVFLFALIFPAVPFLRCFFSVRRAKKEVAEEKKRTA